MNRQVIKNRIRKVLAYSVTGVSFVLISAFLTIQIPAVQESIVSRYLRIFSQATGFQASVSDFRLLWFDRLELEDLVVVDPANNEMIRAKNVLVNFRLAQLLHDRDINIDGVAIDSANVYITRIDESDTSRNLNINVFINRINEHYSSSSPGGRTPRVNIGEAVLAGSRFSYVDQDRDSIKSGFNYNQFSVDIDEAQLRNFVILGDTTQFRVNTLLATDRQSKLAVKQLSTFFRLSQERMEFTGLDLQANNSTVKDTIIFTFNGQRELSDFVEKVKIHATLDNTVIDPRDLALFAPEAGRMTRSIKLSGVFNGRINDFKFTDMEIATGNSVLRGSLDMDGLPDLTETFIILNLKNAHLDFQDLDFAISPAIMTRLLPIGTVAMDGQFLGYTTDFVAKGNFSGSLGSISSDINFKVNDENFDRSEYSGALVLRNFDLGHYLGDTVNFQTVSLDGKVKGAGLTVGTADFTLTGKVNNIGIRSYDYTNIVTDARFAAERFNGFLKIDDPNLKFSARGSLDLRQGQERIQVEAQLDTAILHHLNLTDRSVFLQSKLNVNTRGLQIDSLVGTADLQDFTVQYNEQRLSLSNIHFKAEKTGTNRSVEIETTLANASAEGDFNLSDITQDVQKLVGEIALNIRNDESEIAGYYQTMNYNPRSYQARFGVEVKDIEPLAALLNVDLDIAANTRIEGSFTSGYTTILQLYSFIDSLSYNENLLLDTDVELTASKIADSTSVLAMAFVNSRKQIINGKLHTDNLVTEAIWNKSHVNFQLDLEQSPDSNPKSQITSNLQTQNETSNFKLQTGNQEPGTSNQNYVRLKGEVDFLRDSTLIHLLPSTINLLEKKWTIEPTNLITFQPRNVHVQQLRVRHKNQYVLLDGHLSENPEDKLTLEIDNLDLSILNPLTGRDIRGRLQAIFHLSDYFSNPYLQNDVFIDSLMIDKFLIGDITGKNQLDTVENRFLLDFHIDRNDARIVNINGSYNPSHRSNPLDVKARLENAHLRIAEPFFDEIFSNIGGTITGDFHISGTLDSPAIAGEGKVDSGRIMVNYLNTLYDFTGSIGLSPNSVYFRNIDLVDNFRNRATLDATITHNNFRDTRINVQSAFRNFQVLNTTAKDNSLFYGQGFATGDLNISGPISNLKFTSTAKTDKNTRIYIPIGDDDEIEKKEFIKFVNFSDSTFQKNISNQVANKLDLTGITLDFNIDVTDDAYCEILLNDQAGDKIRGRGNGELQLQLDTKGEFNMFGPFEFTDGWYTFTLYDLINKEFEIKKGSRITWYGDAYEGNLDISATYNQQASLAPIITDTEIRESPPLRRKYPVQVLIELDGPMLSPQIDFDIVTQDLPQSIVVEGHAPVRLDFEFQAFKNKMDEQELKRQVFSLIVLRRFSPPESFNTTGSDVINSVSELFSNQLSNFVSQVDENLEIDVDFSRMDEEEFNTFQLRLSYTFLNGRLRVTRDGTFYSSQNNNTSINQNLSSLAGDWMVDYLLTADGKLKVKMYNRTNINPIFNSIGAQNSVTTGVSINHTQSFNELRDLWNARKKKDEEEEEGATKEYDDSSRKGS